MPRTPNDMEKCKKYDQQLRNRRMIERKKVEADKELSAQREQAMINRLKREHGPDVLIHLSRRKT